VVTQPDHEDEIAGGRRPTVVPLVTVHNGQSLARGSSKDNDDGGLVRNPISRRALSLRRRLLAADPAEPVHEQVIDYKLNIYSKRAQLSQRKGVMPSALWYTDIFGLEVYNHVQKLSSYASVNARCNFITDRCHQIGVHVIAGMTPRIMLYLK